MGVVVAIIILEGKRNVSEFGEKIYIYSYIPVEALEYHVSRNRVLTRGQCKAPSIALDQERFVKIMIVKLF